jgi:ABC-type amino acid transport substrate-binding protein
VRIVGVAVAVVLAATAISHAEVRRIRLCADPSNLPFSSQASPDAGFEVDIARAVADHLGAELSVHWFPSAREMMTLRQLYEGRCDLVMGLPVTEAFTDDKPRLLFTTPYYVMGLAVVSPTVGAVRSLDGFERRLVGVQAMTSGDHLVYERGYRRKVYLRSDEVFTALTRTEVDAVVIESPLAGWFVKRNPGFTAVDLGDRARELGIGAAVRKTDRELRDAVDRAIAHLRGTSLPGILARYGAVLAQAAPKAEELSPALGAARTTYLTQCSQCHGVDALGTNFAANLRTFKGSEGDFLRIVRNGRPGTAMTPWKGLIPDEEILNIARYVKGLTP